MTEALELNAFAEKNPRFIELDIMKGFGMIFLMFWHSFSPIAHYFGIFFLAMFLMVSGFTWNEKRTQTWKDVRGLIKKRFKDLMVPYFIYSIIFLTLIKLFLMLKMYPLGEFYGFDLLGSDGHLSIGEYFIGLLLISLGFASSVFTGALWYLYQLFLVYVVHAVVCRIFRKFMTTKSKRLVFYLILIAALIFIMQYFHSIEDEKFKLVKLLSIRFLCCYVAFVMGVPARILYDKMNVRGVNMLHAILFVVTGLFLYFMSGFTKIDIGAGNITAVWSYVLCGILGFIFMYCLSVMIENTQCTKKIVNALSYVGQNTMPIMAYHLLCFKPVALIYILIFGLSFDKLQQFPIIMDENYTWMWIFYSISGIVLSLILDRILTSLKNLVIKK